MPADLVKDMHIGVESIRNGFSCVLLALPGFVHLSVRLVPPEELPPAAVLREMWELLRVEEAQVEFLVASRVVWKDGALCCDRACATRPDFMLSLSNEMLSVFRFKEFTDSRWNSFGPSMRPVIAGWHLGLDSLVKGVVDDKDCQSWYIGGWLRLLKPHVRTEILVGGLSAIALEAAVNLILKDDRLLRAQGAVWEAIRSAVAGLDAVSDAAWSLLASCCVELDGPILRSRVLGAAHTSIAFFWFRCLRILEDYPWRLAEGSVDANLRELAGLKKARPPSPPPTRLPLAFGSCSRTVMPPAPSSRQPFFCCARFLGQHASWNSFTPSGGHGLAPGHGRNGAPPHPHFRCSTEQAGAEEEQGASCRGALCQAPRGSASEVPCAAPRAELVAR